MENTFLRGSHSELLAELYKTGDLLSGCERDSNLNLSDETYVFLKQKLSEAHASISTLAQKESILNSELEQLKRDKQDHTSQISILRTELQTQRAKNLANEQKADNETHQRYLLQEKIVGLEKELNERKARNELVENEKKELLAALSASENFTRQVYQLAVDSCEQSKALKEQVAVLDDLLSTCKTTISKLHDEKSKVTKDYEYTKSEYANLESVFREALAEIDLMKDESMKQEDYINDTLERFKEIGIHFNNMKSQFLQQHKKLEDYHQEIKDKHTADSCMRSESETKLKELSELNQKFLARENELRNKISLLEETVNAMVAMRRQLEEKNKKLELTVVELRNETNRLQDVSTSLHSTLATERVKCDDTKSCLVKEKEEKDNLKQKIKNCKEQLKEYEMKVLKSENENKEKEVRKVELENKLSNLQETVKSLKEMNEKLLQENAKLVQKVKNKEHELKASIQDGNNVESCLQQRSKDSLKVLEQYATLVKEKENIQKDRELLRTDLENLRQNTQDKERSVVELENKLQQCQMLFVQNEEKVATLSNRIARLVSERENDQSMIQSLNEQIDELNDALTESHHAVDDYQTEIIELKQQLQLSIDDKERLRLQLTENLKNITEIVEEEEKKMRLEYEEKDKNIEMLDKKLTLSQETIQTQKLQLDRTNEKLILITSKNESMSEEISRLLEHRKSTESSLKSYIEKEESLNNEVLALSLRLKDVENLLETQQLAFQKHKDKTASYNEIWEAERSQAIKELQYVLQQEQRTPKTPRQLTLLKDDTENLHLKH